MVRKFNLRTFLALGVSCAFCDGNMLEEQGRKALKYGISEVAAVRFQAALGDASLDQKGRERIGLLLMESLVRAGKFEEALDFSSKLIEPIVSEALFWKGLSLAGCGKYADAEAELQAYSMVEKGRYYEECLLTLARVQANRGDLRSALKTYNFLGEKSRYAARAGIDQSQIFMILEDYASARKVLPPRKGLSKIAEFEVGLVDARLLLAEGKAGAAMDGFASLRKKMTQKESSTNVKPLVMFDGLHWCLIGEARAKYALGKTTEATDALLAFVQNYPQSPFLSEAFDDLIRWMPPYQADADDPVRARILERFDSWSPISGGQGSAIEGDVDGSLFASVYAEADRIPFEDLHAHALHARIVMRHQEGEVFLPEMRSLLFAMQTLHPNHRLTFESWLLWAKYALVRSDREEAMRVLDFLVALSSGVTQVNASLLLAREAFAVGDFQLARECFGSAATMLRADAKRSALLGAAMGAMNQNQSSDFDKIFNEAHPKLKVELMLEQALYAIRESPDVALAKLDEFLLEHPRHQRADEARVAIAQCAVRMSPADSALAKSQLESVSAEGALSEPVALAWCQLFFTEGNFTELAERCRAFIAAFPESESVGSVKLKLGVALYQMGEFGDARIVLQQLATENEALREPATMVAARAAARSGTPQSIQEAGRLFDSISDSSSALAQSAILEKSRVFLDSKKLENVQIAENDLSELLAKLKGDSPLVTSASLLKIEVLYALGAKSTTNYSLGLQLQKKLLESPNLSSEDRCRVYYYRGLSYEQLGSSQDALNAYYEVIESASRVAPLSWEFVNRCGFNALSILEKNESWVSGIAFAKKFAALGGPRSEEALERARRISLENFIFDQ